jgi:hypothetical protein
MVQASAITPYTSACCTLQVVENKTALLAQGSLPTDTDLTGEWHRLQLTVAAGAASATFDGAPLQAANGSIWSVQVTQGMLGLESGRNLAGFDAFATTPV